jgi:hypothetical protein
MGRKRAREYFDIHQYVGPAPIFLEMYRQAVARQRLHKGWLTQEALKAAYKDAVLEPEVLEQIGPAANSGKSLLIYGMPGNGRLIWQRRCSISWQRRFSFLMRLNITAP